MPLIEHGALRIDCVADGDGPAVVLAHGSVSGNRQWRRLIELLKGRYRLTAPNLLGYGQTTTWPADRPQTLDDAAQVLLAVCARVDAPIRLVGHSWGGAVALRTASALGTQVSHLALYEPMLTGLLRGHARVDAWQEAATLHADVERFGRSGQWDALARRFTEYFNGEGTWDATPEDRRRLIAASLAPNVHEWEAGSQTRTAADLAGIRARTLLLRGSDTRRVLRETVDVLHGAFPHWEVEECAGCGHMGPLTHADAINQRIAAFLDSPGARLTAQRPAARPCD